MYDRMLDDLERNVDRTDSKLSDAMRRMKKFIRQTEGESVNFNSLCPISWEPQRQSQGGA